MYGQLLATEERFRYQLLSRLQMDCNYYLNYGCQNAECLWAKDEKEQISCMRLLWNSFSQEDKPEWLTWEDILEYETKMCVNQ